LGKTRLQKIAKAKFGKKNPEKLVSINISSDSGLKSEHLCWPYTLYHHHLRRFKCGKNCKIFLFLIFSCVFFFSIQDMSPDAFESSGNIMEKEVEERKVIIDQ
jgi:hypothetical protein